MLLSWTVAWQIPIAFQWSGLKHQLLSWLTTSMGVVNRCGNVFFSDPWPCIGFLGVRAWCCRPSLGFPKGSYLHFLFTPLMCWHVVWTVCVLLSAAVAFLRNSQQWSDRRMRFQSGDLWSLNIQFRVQNLQRPSTLPEPPRKVLVRQLSRSCVVSSGDRPKYEAIWPHTCTLQNHSPHCHTNWTK